MKKVFLILLAFLTLSSYGQAEFEKVAITSNVATASTSKIVSQQPTTGELNYIDAASLPVSGPTQAALDLKLNISDLPTNLTLYPTTTASDVSGYVVMVKDIHDVRYNTAAVDVSTPTITTTDQLVSQRISDAGVLIGQPGVFNITTFGNIRHLSGSGTATFYFKVFHRDAAGVETLICTSSVSAPVTDGGYSEFTASGVWDDGDFVATDRIVIKSYANRIAGGSDPVYQFQFGGVSPVRTLLPVPFSVVDAGYEMKTNKQNSLVVDGTGVKYPTVDAVNTITGVPYNSNLYTNESYLYGDSITTGYGAEPISAYGWNSIVPQKLGTTNTNYAIGGTTLVYFYAGDKSGIERLTEITPLYDSNKRVYISGIGVNDIGGAHGTYNATNFRNAYYQLIDRLITTQGWPANKIFLWTPYVDLADSAALDALVQDIATVKGVNFIPVRAAMLAGGGSSLVPVDGLHPINAGHKIIAETIYNFISGTKYNYTQFNQDISTTGNLTVGRGISGGTPANGLELRAIIPLTGREDSKITAFDNFNPKKNINFIDNLTGVATPFGINFGRYSYALGNSTWDNAYLKFYNNGDAGTFIGVSNGTGLTLSSTAGNDGGTITLNGTLSMNKSVKISSPAGGTTTPLFFSTGQTQYTNVAASPANTQFRGYGDSGISFGSVDGVAIVVNGLPDIISLKSNAKVFGNLEVTGNIPSPTLTGIPTAPTATAGTNTTQIATTAFVQAKTTDWTKTGNDIRNNNTGEIELKPLTKVSVLNSSNTEVASLGNSGRISGSSFKDVFWGSGMSFLDGGQFLKFNANNGNTNYPIFSFTPDYTSFNSGAGVGFIGLYSGYTIAPTSGSVPHTMLQLTPTINQTGGANGITRGIYINPTITSASDFRAIDVTGGKVVVSSIVEYADNAAAITAGLPIGAFYRTGDLLKIVH